MAHGLIAVRHSFGLLPVNQGLDTILLCQNVVNKYPALLCPPGVHCCALAPVTVRKGIGCGIRVTAVFILFFQQPLPIVLPLDTLFCKQLVQLFGADAIISGNLRHIQSIGAAQNFVVV